MSALLALETKLLDYCTANGLIYVQENALYDGSDNHVRSFLLPTEPLTGVNFDSFEYHRNIWQISVYVKKGTFAGRLRQISDGIMNEFKRGRYVLSGSNFTDFGINIESIWLNPASLDEQWYYRPISIRYQAFL